LSSETAVRRTNPFPSASPHRARGFLKAELWLPLALLLVAFAAGGSSGNQPIRDVIVELVAVVVLAAAVSGLVGRSFSRDALPPLILLGAVLVLVLFQLMPLPSGLWLKLEGRQVSSDVLNLIGFEGRSHPLSVQPELTVLAALGMLPGVAMAVAVMRLSTPTRLVLAWACVALALASLLLGTLQVGVGRGNPDMLNLYRTSHSGLPIGVFANTNHQADLLVIGFVLAGVLAPSRAQTGQSWFEKPYWAYGIMIALAIGVVATGSRSGIALLGVGLGAVVLRERLTGHVRTFLISAIALAVALALLIWFNPVFTRSFADFSDLDDRRFYYWPNIVWAVGQFGWWGSGLGTFENVYLSAETLTTLSPRYLNHAHNDYLELALEVGLPGLLLVLAFLLWVAFRAAVVLRGSDPWLSRMLSYGALICIGILLLHSGADYPLRTPLLCTIFGLCCGLITKAPSAAPDTSAPRDPPDHTKNPSIQAAMEG
jgi:O-antigen ligase